MAENANLMDKIMGLPKWALGLIGAVLLGFFGFLIYLYGIKPFLGPKEETAVVSQPLDFPDAENEEVNAGRKDFFERLAHSGGGRQGGGSSSVNDYWDNLAGGGTSDSRGGLSGAFDDPEDVSLNTGTFTPESWDPYGYSQLEMTQMRNGLKTKAQIDEEHRQKIESDRREKEERAREARREKERMAANSDSAYFARIDQAYAIAAKYMGSAGMGAPLPEGAPTVAEQEQEEVERKLNLEAAAETSLPTDILSDDGIISSLDSPSSDGVVHYSSQHKPKPIKATFLKNEKVTNGQRVIIRLMQDMTLSDGTTIPANTHITGTCSFGRRMKINVSMLHYGGKMFPTDISVYDNDGTEGIYCQLVGDEKKLKQIGRVAGDVASSAASIASTLFTGNILLGAAARSSLQSLTGSIDMNGTVSVNVTSGYEFYVFENIKEDQKNK